MTDAPALPAGSVPLSRSLDIILIGMVVYGLLAFGLLQGPDVFPFGQNLYDEYFLAIIDGHLDLPPRVAQVEGHYTPDGVAYLYHGVGPLVTRFLFGWIWPFESVSLAPLSIWIWACLGTLCYHAAFMQAAGQELDRLGAGGQQTGRLLSIAVWFGSPGILLAASSTFYHEPISLAFAATGVFVLVWTLFAFGDWPLWRLALPSAAAAAIALHARPNVAIGLYLAAVLLLAWLAATSLRRHWLRIALALAILGASGLGFLALNAARFGSLTETHGSFSKSDVQYGFVFWGAEDRDSERAAAFREHGKFNVARVPHNLFVYAFDLPDLGAVTETARERFRAFASNVLGAGLGFIRMEAPYAGLVFLWPLWLLLGVFAAFAARGSWRRMAIPLAGTAATAGLTLAYGTITLRYRVDLWPFISLLALLGLPALLSRCAATPRSGVLKSAAGACFLVGLFMSAYCVSQLRFFQTGPDLKPSWSLEECETLIRYRDFSPADAKRICQPPRVGTPGAAGNPA